MSELMSLFGFCLAAGMALVAYVCWRKAMSFHVLLLESSGRIESLKKRAIKLEKERATQRENVDSEIISSKKNEKKLKSEIAKLNEANNLLKSEVVDLSEKLHLQKLKTDHLVTQSDALTQQLKEADFEAKEAQRKLSYAQKDASEKQSTQQATLKEELALLKKQNAAVTARYDASQTELTRIKKLAMEVDIERIKDIKRKAGHYENLYKSMKGLREMADERNRNWEDALRKLASWVLKSSGSPLDPDQTPLGPVVGEALEIVGARLVQDQFTRPRSEEPVNRN